MKANRDFNGCLRLETLAGFVDDSLVVDESEFLETIKDIDANDGDIFGIISSDVFDVLNNAYPVNY
jgi:hypothetical protein